MQKSTVLIGAIFIVVAIILGAFGAHALKAVLSEEKLLSFETGVRYQLIQGVSLLIIGLNSTSIGFELKLVERLLIIGTILFSISIYLLAMADLLGVSMKWLGPVTPIGGSLMIIGWFVFIFRLILQKDNQ
jgi:uncharacterized membrane protein YgdD (TMEM256/DUF423 family)